MANVNLSRNCNRNPNETITLGLELCQVYYQTFIRHHASGVQPFSQIPVGKSIIRSNAYAQSQIDHLRTLERSALDTNARVT